MARRHAGLWRLLTVYSLKQLNGEQPIWRKLSTTAPVVGIYRINTISRKMSTEQGKAGGLADDVIEKLCHEPDESTKDFIMQQTMYRIKDPKRSLEFYTKVLGMRLLQKFDFPTMEFSLYFMGYEDAEDIPKDRKERTKWMFTRKATIELTHNWGTENEEGDIYKTGNEKEHKGFGHIGLHVPDVYKACERFEKMGVQFVKKPDDGKMKGLAFIKDPDGYWIEILSSTRMASDIQ